MTLANQLEASVLEQYADSWRRPNYEQYIQTKVGCHGTGSHQLQPDPLAVVSIS